MKLLSRALFLLALIVLAASLNIRQEQAAVQATKEATPVEAKVEATPEVKQEEEEGVETTEAKKQNDENEEQQEVEEASEENAEAKKKNDENEEQQEVEEASEENAEAKKKNDENEENQEVEEASEENAEAKKKNDEDEENQEVEASEEDAAAKKQTAAKTTVQAKQEEATTTLTVLTPEGTTKQVTVADSTKDLDNSRNCQRDNENNPQIQLCANLSCDECLNSDVCGWCGESARCMPGNTGDALCPGDCLNHWFFHDKTACPREINAGSLSNVAPDATKLINPELAAPKVRTVTVEQNEAKLAVNVVVGTQTTTTTSRANPGDGIVDEVTQTQTTPIVQDLVQKAPLNTVVTEEIHDLATGEKLA